MAAKALRLLTCAAGCVVLVVYVACARSFLFTSRLKGPGHTCVRPRIFVGVFSDGGGAAKYAERRSALRATWFPNTTDALNRVECTYGITIRFVVGRSVLTDDSASLQAWYDETSEHNDFLRLDALDTYRAMTGKTAEMFRHVIKLPQKYEYVVKVDDDMFVSLSHLARAVDQWADMGVDYVGCMTNPGLVYRIEGKFYIAHSKAYSRRCR